MIDTEVEYANKTITITASVITLSSESSRLNDFPIFPAISCQSVSRLIRLYFRAKWLTRLTDLYHLDLDDLELTDNVNIGSFSLLASHPVGIYHLARL